MYPTVFGLVLIPLSLLWANKPVRLLRLALVASVFEAAAALVIGGSFGLQPAMVPGLLFMAYIGNQYLLGMRYPGERQVLWTMAPLVLLLGYALLSVALLPDAFAGKIMVWPQKMDPLAPGATPLAFTSGNVTQSLYLLLNVGFAVGSALFLTRAAVPYRRIVGAYLLGGYVVVGLSFWQFASRIAGLPFPDEILQSNPGWAIVDQSMGSVPRIQGPFSEPAALASYLSGLCFCCMVLSVRGHRLMRPDLLLALAVTTILLSTSTTGIAVLFVGMPLMLAFTAGRGGARALARAGATIGMLALVALLVIGPLLILRPELLDSVNTVVQLTLTKGDSESYTERTGRDAAALDTVGETYGLGVGWGSFRASSLLPGLLANAGVFGVLAVLWLGLRIRRLTLRAGAGARGHPGQVLLDGFSAALCGQLAAALLAAPTISSLSFFLQLGCVVGTAARMLSERRLRLAAMPAIVPIPTGDLAPDTRSYAQDRHPESGNSSTPNCSVG